MTKESIRTSRRFGPRLVSQARALLAVSALAALAVTHRASAQTTQTLTILGGSGNAGDVAANVEYYNPATSKWQQAYLVSYAAQGHANTHPWGNVAGTTRWVSYKADGASDPGASGTNPLWYRYRVRFTVPADAVNPQMTFSLKADNRANVWINGASTGPTIVGQADALNADAVFAQNVFVGENTITLDVGDEGGLNGFNFRIDLSMQSSQPLGIVAAGAPTTFASAPVLTVPANITVNATSAAGAPVTFSASATSHETVEVFRRSTTTAEQWRSYSTTFTSGVTGNFTLGFNVVSASGGDNSIFIDEVKVTSGASTPLSDGFEPPAQGNITQDVSTPATLGSNWYFNNYGGILRPPTPSGQPWGSIANGTPPEGSQFAVLRDVLGVQTKMTSTGQISLVAGQTYTVSFQQASREIFGGDTTYTVTFERQISVPVIATPASGSTFPIGTTTVNLSATTNGGTTNGSFNVTVNTIPVAITLGNLAHVYDGSVKSASATTKVNGFTVNIPVNLSYTGAQLPPVNAGNYGVFASVSLPYTGTASGTLVIAQAPSTTVVTINGAPFTYNGSAQTPATVAVTGAGGLSLTPTASYANNTNAGTATASYTYAGDANHTGSSDSKTFTIDKASSTTVVTISGAPFTYNGSAQTPATVAVTGAGGLSLTPTASYVNNTNAGTATASYLFTGDANHTGSSDSKTFTINRANATVSVSGYTGTYDAAAHGASGTATGVGGVALPGLNLGASFTDAPGGTANWTFAGGINYNDAIGSAAIVITKADATIAVNGYTGIYDAAAHGATGSATGVGGVDLSSGLSLGASFTDAPGGTANWTFAGGTNYNDAAGSAAVVINKATATVAVSGYTGTYDAAAHGATGSATGVGGVALGGLNLGASFTDAPGGTANWTFAGGTNYNDAAGSAAVVINKATATVAVSGYTGIFDAAAHGASGSATGVGGVALPGLNLGASFTSVPGGTANWTFAGGTNYNDASGSAAIVINKATATITVNGYTGIYDTAAHGATGSATGVGGVALPGLNLGASFTSVPGGTANWTFAGGTNYNDASGSAAIVINKATATVVVTPYNVEYDGLPHSATVTSITGVGGESGATVGVVTLNSTHTSVGIYADSWSFAGANYNSLAGALTDTIKDTTAPVITSAMSNAPTLWPPNHKMVAVTVSASATDLVGVASLKIINVTSNEPDNGLGDGDTAGDIQVTGNLTLNLRAERGGGGNGRIYTITVEAKDAAGNASTRTVTVSVPKSQGGK